MAYDFARRKIVGKNWSCNVGSASEIENDFKSKLPAIATIGVIGFGLWAIVNQPSGKELQQYHLLRERK